MVSVSAKIAYFIFISGAFAVAGLVAGGYAVVALVLVFIFFFGVFAGRQISRPLKKILRTANELADGNLHARAHVNTNDELGQLTKALNRLAQKMEASCQEKEKLERSVAMKVNSLIHPLHETIEALEEKVSNRTRDMHQALELSEKLQINTILKEAEFIDLKGELAKLMKRKSRKIINEKA